ncbi:MAG: 4a-hydroxytetrahydrobiopterin dehydratase [Acidobacteriota bacterium]
MATLTPAEAAARLEGLEGWTLDGNAIRKQFTFRDFPEAVLFVSALVPGAEEADHHPDVTINYRRVTLSYSTHSEGGLTDKDFDGARMADHVAATLPDLEQFSSD